MEATVFVLRGFGLERQAAADPNSRRARAARYAGQAAGPVSLKWTVTVMMTGVGTPFTSVGV